MSTLSSTPQVAEHDRLLSDAGTLEGSEFDYIIIGSGAGGGPLACRLALGGKKVLLIEAGSDPAKAKSKDYPKADVGEVHDTPGYHGAATEEAEMSWSNSVRHYDDVRQTADHKYDARRDPSSLQYDSTLPGSSLSQHGHGKGGVFYPRSSGLGGCTGHHAMIVIRPNDRDWNQIAQETGDDSWRAEQMQPYFARFERCLYRNEYRGFLGKLFGGLGYVVQKVLAWVNPRAALAEGGHGRTGWQPTSFIAPDLIQRILKQDSRFARVLIGTLLSVSDRVRRKRSDDGTRIGWLRDLVTFVKRIAIRWGIVNAFDPNDLNRRAKASWEGAYLIPVGIETEKPPTHTNAFDEHARPLLGRRAGVREFILRTQKECRQPDHAGELVLQSEAYVTQLLFGPGKEAAQRVTGVQCSLGRHLYHASPLHGEASSTEKPFYVKQGCGEVILCGGSYNTPQLLMLSGIGDKEHLSSLEIHSRVHLPGVGRNLQDRYEVGVVSRMRDDFATLANVSFKPGDDNDPARTEWRTHGTGLYASNGGSLAIIRRSEYADDAEPDLFTFGAPAAFRGYYWDWSKQLFRRQKDAANDQRNLWTWVILKAYTRNNGGTVKLRSTDWRVPPDICFNSFAASGCKDWEKDVKALMQAVEEVRDINARIHTKHADLFMEEIQPGPALLNNPPMQRDENSPLGQWIQNEAWGHHACGTCRIGKDAWRADPALLNDKGAVLASDFRVHGVEGLRVVDASVFPKIPGYFILAPIFMISEKAADTLLHPKRWETYPEQVRKIEAEAIQQRRVAARVAVPPTPAGEACLPPRTVGLALSGGGIRSATFALGVLQVLAEKNRLRAVDFLSTVSGGGFTGSFLGRLFTQRTVTQADDPVARVQEQVSHGHSPALRWLRRNGNYLISSGADDKWQMLGIFYRNLFAVHLVIGLFLFGLFGTLAGLAPHLTLGDLSFGTLLSLPWSPWWWLPAGVFALVLLPCTLGYWLARKPGSTRPYSTYGLAAWLVLVGASAAALTVPGGYVFGLAGLGLLGLAWLWQEFAHLAPDANPRHERSAGNRVRNRMSRLLEVAFKLLAVSLFWLVLDTVARSVAGRGWTATLAQLMAALAPVLAVMRNGLLNSLLPGGGTGILTRLTQAAGVLLLLFLLLVLDVFAHELAAVPNAGWLWWTVVVCALFSLVLGRAFDLLNFTSLHTPYAARILRTFQGAANEARIHAGSTSPYNDVQVVHPDDDISHHRYRPEQHGGPLHLINVCINETVDHHSLRDVPDRHGLPMAVGSFGVSVGSYFATWVPPGRLPWWRRFNLWLDGFPPDTTDPVALKAVRRDDDPETFHPLGRRDGNPTVPDKLSLGAWTAISGAAFSTGIGRRTSLVNSTLRGLMNLRLGYWWNSGTLAGERPGQFPGNAWRQLFDLPGFLFRTQQLLLAEWQGRFRGPSRPLWNLSDGGHQEVTALYELIRRRVQFMIVCDAGQDTHYQFADLGELERQIFQDFQAVLQWITPVAAGWKQVPDWIKEWFDEAQIGLAHQIGRQDTHTAALACVTYAAQPQEHSWILLLKPSLGKNLSSLALLDYAREHPDFPQQPTTDQFFDDVQWESYRRLGHHLGSQVLR